MKSSASESVKNGYLNLERLSRSSRLVQPGIPSFGMALIQTPKLSCAEPNASIIITYFTSSFGFRFLYKQFWFKLN